MLSAAAIAKTAIHEEAETGAAARRILGAAYQEEQMQLPDLAYDDANSRGGAEEVPATEKKANDAPSTTSAVAEEMAPSADVSEPLVPVDEDDDNDEKPKAKAANLGPAGPTATLQPKSGDYAEAKLDDEVESASEVGSAKKTEQDEEQAAAETAAREPLGNDASDEHRKHHQEEDMEKSMRRAGSGSTTGGTGAPQRDSVDDSTPFTVLAGHGFSGTSGTFSEDGSDDAGCRKKCEDSPDCGGYSMQASKCWVNTNKIYTPIAIGGATLYHKKYRTQTIQPALTFGGLKFKSHMDHNCLDNPGWSSTDATTYTCDLDTNRNWTFSWTNAASGGGGTGARRVGAPAPPRGTFQLQSRKTSTAICLSADGTETGAKLVACSVTDPKQKWTLLESHQLRNQNQGQCDPP